MVYVKELKMNKRILKLFNEAGFHQPEMERLGIENKFEKFAESIVKECANIVNSLEQYEGQGDCPTAEYIKEHFGVNE